MAMAAAPVQSVAVSLSKEPIIPAGSRGAEGKMALGESDGQWSMAAAKVGRRINGRKIGAIAKTGLPVGTCIPPAHAPLFFCHESFRHLPTL